MFALDYQGSYCVHLNWILCDGQRKSYHGNSVPPFANKTSPLEGCPFPTKSCWSLNYRLWTWGVNTAWNLLWVRTLLRRSMVVRCCTSCWLRESFSLLRRDIMSEWILHSFSRDSIVCLSAVIFNLNLEFSWEKYNGPTDQIVPGPGTIIRKTYLIHVVNLFQKIIRLGLLMTIYCRS